MTGEDSAIVRLVADEIRTSGPMSFERFMSIALHHPDLGYYAGGPDRLGRAGDYVTASDAGREFGACMARQLVEIDRILGHPEELSVVEFGAGRGLLARDVCETLRKEDPGVRDRLRYVLVDSSAGMRQAALSNAPGCEVLAPGEVRSGRQGCVLAVELFDALPVHRVRRRNGALVEVFVDLDEAGALVERELPAGPEVAVEAGRYGAAPGDGDEAEVSTVAAGQLDAMAAVLDRGFLVIVDYGYPAAELYGPTHRRGTLLGYHRHTTTERYLERVGEQDLTAHVNFTQLTDRARERGLGVVGFTTQDRFLISNGILACFDSDDRENWSDPSRVRGRLEAMRLIHPSAMGRAFRVLVLSRGIDPPPTLAGLADPFAPGARGGRSG